MQLLFETFFNISKNKLDTSDNIVGTPGIMYYALGH